ncbi:hypothetical protein RC52_21975 [Herbaspirillum rubrisubalbicans]|nr:hypothetical protein [Herbaspirillum rubrisubalbicans]
MGYAFTSARCEDFGSLAHSELSQDGRSSFALIVSERFNDCLLVVIETEHVAMFSDTLRVWIHGLSPGCSTVDFLFVSLNAFQHHEAEKGRASSMVLNRISGYLFRLVRIETSGHHHGRDIFRGRYVKIISLWQ